MTSYLRNYKEILEPENTYHIYNCAVGSDRLFRSKENYNYFLLKYEEYITPIADTFCYCLMPNHFHFLVRIKSVKELLEFSAGKRGGKNRQGFGNLDGLNGNIRQGFGNLDGISGLPSAQFSNFFNGYSKAFNKMYKRKGSLMMHTFNRIKVLDENQFRTLVFYIHYNPVKANLCSDLQKWSFSSYSVILNNEKTFIERDEILKRFDDKRNFTQLHQNKEF